MLPVEARLEGRPKERKKSRPPLTLLVRGTPATERVIKNDPGNAGCGHARPGELAMPRALHGARQRGSDRLVAARRLRY